MRPLRPKLAQRFGPRLTAAVFACASLLACDRLGCQPPPKPPPTVTVEGDCSSTDMPVPSAPLASASAEPIAIGKATRTGNIDVTFGDEKRSYDFAIFAVHRWLIAPPYGPPRVALIHMTSSVSPHAIATGEVGWVAPICAAGSTKIAVRLALPARWEPAVDRAIENALHAPPATPLGISTALELRQPTPP